MTASGPNFTPFRHCYQWQSCSGTAGRFCPSDQAGARPEVATRIEMPARARLLTSAYRRRSAHAMEMLSGPDHMTTRIGWSASTGVEFDQTGPETNVLGRNNRAAGNPGVPVD
jgi:hypothetical protein